MAERLVLEDLPRAAGARLAQVRVPGARLRRTGRELLAGRARRTTRPVVNDSPPRRAEPAHSLAWPLVGTSMMSIENSSYPDFLCFSGPMDAE